MLWYGQSKMLKTTLALLAPPWARPIDYLDADKGAQIRMRLLSLDEAGRKKLGIEDSPVYELAGPWVREGIKFYEPEVATYYKDLYDFATVTTPRSGSKTIVVDTCSRIGDELLKEVKGVPLKTGDKVTDNRSKYITGGIETVHPTQSDYGAAQDRIMEFIGALVDRNPGKNIILISHEKTGEIKDSSGQGRVLAGPRTIGNALIEVIPSIVDIALRFEPRQAMVKVKGKDGKEVVRQVQTVAIRSRNHNIYIAGDRSGLFEDGELMDPQVVWGKLAQILDMAAREGAATK